MVLGFDSVFFVSVVEMMFCMLEFGCSMVIFLGGSLVLVVVLVSLLFVMIISSLLFLCKFKVWLFQVCSSVVFCGLVVVMVCMIGLMVWCEGFLICLWFFVMIVFRFCVWDGRVSVRRVVKVIRDRKRCMDFFEGWGGVWLF